MRVATYRDALKEQMKNAKEILDRAHNPITGKKHVKNIVDSVIEREAGVASKVDCNKRKTTSDDDHEQDEEEDEEAETNKSKKKKKGVSGQIGKECYFFEHNL